MSSGQKHRTPLHFPHMKVRGARRRRLAPFQRAAAAFHELGRAGVAFVPIVPSITGFSDQKRRSDGSN